MTEDFNINELRIDKAEAQQAMKARAANGKTKLPRSTENFGRVSREHMIALDKAGVRSFVVWRLLCEIAWLNFANKGKRFRLSNKAVKAMGLSHASKTRALQIFTKLKIVRLEGAIRKSPWITPLM
jgi:hypothetical protein